MYRRISVALLVAVLSAACCYYQLIQLNAEAADFTWSLRGAQQLLAGLNPYHDPTLGPAFPYPHNDPLFYPLPALLIALPFVAFPPALAGALFFGCSSGLLAFGLTRENYARLPVFLSVPFINALGAAQWSPLITAAALIPALFPVILAKPSLGLPIAVTYPTRRGVLACAAILLGSLLVLPTWPYDWLNNIGQHRDLIPLLLFPGQLLVLAALRWREKRARLLLTMALIPQVFYYDPLALWLIPHSFRESMLLSLLSWIGFFVATQLQLPVTQTAVIGVAFIYLPALAIVIRPTLTTAFQRLRRPHAAASST